MNREQELIRIIADATDELAKLKGPMVTLCGYCYHRDEGDRITHLRNSPGCYATAYPCPTKVYERGVTFDEYGKANIDWDNQ